ncbi:hypothetical protein HMPREF1221_01686 [Treponema socranskii subsp. paredis ATCC 35535]|nr:hypothetical protein HMPREF1221_01686 [Treponema socranskii subsp. paredis ATCC 35535]
MATVFWGLMIPFAGTTLGAACVFFMKREMHDGVRRALMGFAAGVMVAASVWSLLIPSIEMAEAAKSLSFIPALVGFLFGIAFLFSLDRITPHLQSTHPLPKDRNRV